MVKSKLSRGKNFDQENSRSKSRPRKFKGQF